MIVNLHTGRGQVPLDDTDFRPPSVGEFLAAAMKRRGVSANEVSSRTGIKLEQLNAVLGGKARLDRTFCRKLELLFPKTMNSLLSVQRHYDFFERFGVLRPNSPIERMLVMRRARRAAAFSPISA